MIKIYVRGNGTGGRNAFPAHVNLYKNLKRGQAAILQRKEKTGADGDGRKASRGSALFFQKKLCMFM